MMHIPGHTATAGVLALMVVLGCSKDPGPSHEPGPPSITVWTVESGASSQISSVGLGSSGRLTLGSLGASAVSGLLTLDQILVYGTEEDSAPSAVLQFDEHGEPISLALPNLLQAWRQDTDGEHYTWTVLDIESRQIRSVSLDDPPNHPESTGQLSHIPTAEEASGWLCTIYSKCDENFVDCDGLVVSYEPHTVGLSRLLALWRVNTGIYGVRDPMAGDTEGISEAVRVCEKLAQLREQLERAKTVAEVIGCLVLAEAPPACLALLGLIELLEGMIEHIASTVIGGCAGVVQVAHELGDAVYRDATVTIFASRGSATKTVLLDLGTYDPSHPVLIPWEEQEAIAGAEFSPDRFETRLDFYPGNCDPAAGVLVRLYRMVNGQRTDPGAAANMELGLLNVLAELGMATWPAYLYGVFPCGSYEVEFIDADNSVLADARFSTGVIESKGPFFLVCSVDAEGEGGVQNSGGVILNQEIEGIPSSIAFKRQVDVVDEMGRKHSRSLSVSAGEIAGAGAGSISIDPVRCVSDVGVFDTAAFRFYGPCRVDSRCASPIGEYEELYMEGQMEGEVGVSAEGVRMRLRVSWDPSVDPCGDGAEVVFELDGPGEQAIFSSAPQAAGALSEEIRKCQTAWGFASQATTLARLQTLLGNE